MTVTETKWSKELNKVITQRGKTRESLLPCLKTVQDECGYIPSEAITYLQEALEVTAMDIYGVVSFYGMLTTSKQGENVIRLCESLPCHINGSENILEVLKAELGIEPGETTLDEKFTLETVACLGICDQSPAMMVNEKNYGNLTAEKVKRIIAELKG
ncbi:MAG: NADH-quinone oxidoreductase subunit NuoE [Dehalococcoidales bacterium]|jgi:NADH-quinone oxidoreductase E subunit